MKKLVKILTLTVLSLALAFSALCVYASYSSEDDPLISLSYVNEVLLPQIKDMVYDIIGGKDVGDVVATAPVENTDETLDPDETAEPGETTEEIVTTVAPETTEVVTTEEPKPLFPEGTVNTGAKYDVINLAAGQTLFASVNSCELIVRSGNTKVVSPFTTKWEEQGVSDITDGIEIYNDGKVPTNHSIIIPRDDGRGVVALEGGAWIMVRGDYIIKENTTLEASETTEVKK
jgi:hypothetical protein